MSTLVEETTGASALIGSGVQRSDAVAKVRGDAMYVVDYGEAGMLHAKLLRSPVAAGFVTRLGTEAAKRMPGVVGVFSSRDAPDVCGGLVLRDQRLFASGRVRYEGEPIAGVVAETEAQARDALATIQLEIESIEPVDTLDRAVAADAPLVHPEWERYECVIGQEYPRYGNVASEMVFDPDPESREAAFAAADLVVEGEYRSGRQYHAYLEPRGALARYEDGRVIVHSGSQFPFNVRDQVAQLLDLRPSDVRVVGHHIGGGFGAKLDAGLEPYAALFALLTRRPVKIVNERMEDMLTCPSRENAIVRLRSAFTSSGTLLARELECVMDCGAYSGESPFSASVPIHVLGQVYKPGLARVVSRLLYTNTAPTGAFRGICGVYLCFALERHMDECAQQLGIDRRQFRLDNLVEDGDATLVGQVLNDASILRTAFEQVEEVAPWRELTTKPARPGTLRGVGIAAATWLTNPMAGSVTLKLNEDGTLGVISGATDNGSGAVTMAVTQIAAAELGVAVGDVHVSLPDTDAAGYDAGSQGSRTTHIVGRAIQIAGEELREKILGIAAGALNVSELDLELAEGGVQVKGIPEVRLTLAEVAQKALGEAGPLTATGSYTTPLPAHDPRSAIGLLFPTFPTPTYHVHLAEVEVDIDTGSVEILRYVVAQEVGKMINPTGVRGQIQGGVVQGIGYALYESLEIRDARYVQRTLDMYRLPLAVDCPDVELLILEHPEPQGPYGARGVGEPPIIPVAAALGNAVCDAIGVSVDRIPLRPDDILAALAETDAGDRSVRFRVA